MVFSWNLSDSKSLQVSRTLLSILAILNNVVVWMVSTHPPTSKSSSPYNSPLVTVVSTLITIGIIVTFMFLFFLIPKRVQGTYSSFHFFLFYFMIIIIIIFYFISLLLLLLLLLIRVFLISISWWSFIGDWVTASLLKSPGLFSVFWPFSIMLLFGWSPLGRQLPNLPGP